MRFLSPQAAAIALLGSSALAQAASNDTDFVQLVQDKAFAAINEAEPEAVVKRNSTCTLENAGVRKNWEHLSETERKEYIRAVKCLLSSPSKTDPTLNTGARVRYDDFAAQHINQTMSVHVTGNFLGWHRHYIWSYEQALRNECGYTGYLPYWNWFSNPENLRESPVFDGSETSMGSDGLFVPHNGSIGSAGLHIPSGLGGGCIATGPFANLSANLGPVQPQQDGIVGVGTAEKLKYNPHCVTRDLSSWLAGKIYTKDAFLNVTVRETAKDIASFQQELDSQSVGLPGVHAGGHQTISGSNSDLYSGVVDPAFYLHHTMVDRIFWLWQALHLDQAKTISGTITFANSPPSRNATLDDIIELPYLSVEPATLGSLLDTLDGPYCYVYA
ncbi:Tyrosinase-like protein orsC [Colletotrichum orbiculare MAFF 240422]|uniref:Tyrosinase-like protein orsC n=1 Tax=Colletotrichum orbiculare (strain 104-T / ATCC 96160 / CBS 514.97 / LARS 414 / MAFF 240422) TaxID=1213857 RepID=N4UVF3_COLOR|nr:Tyrosinase-like protein orsC [Colletotrichum orbiculare MAFF 240422]